MKALEQEVVRLREVETRMVREKEALHVRINTLEQTLSLHAIPLPAATDHNPTSAGEDFLSGQTAHVTLRNRGANGQELHVDMPSSGLDYSSGLNQMANVSISDPQAFNSGTYANRINRNREGKGRQLLKTSLSLLTRLFSRRRQLICPT